MSPPKPTLWLLCCAIVFAGGSTVAANPVAPSKPDFREARDVFHRAAGARPPPGLEGSGLAAWRNVHSRKLETMVTTVLETFPREVERWDVIVAFAGARRNLDDEAIDRAREWIRQLLATDDVLEGTREQALRWQVDDRFNQLAADAAVPAAQRLANLRALLDSSEESFLNPRQIVALELRYLEVLLATAPNELDAFRQAVARKRDPVLTRSVERMVVRHGWRREPIELQFVALDGTKIDLRALRGKIVLVDFWLSRNPRRESLDELRQAMETYGTEFAVIGVCCDDAGTSRADLYEDQARKMTQARKRAIEHIALHQFTWPHYFDGLGFDNAVARACGLDTIPARFLIDREGRLSTTNIDSGQLLEKIEEVGRGGPTRR